MSAIKNPGEGIISTIANHVFWFLSGNFFFILLNLPFLLVWSAAYSQSKFSYNVLLVLSLLPTAPALTALLSVMGKLIRNKGIHVLSDFFSAYRKNFFDSLFSGAVILAVLTALYADILYVRTKPSLYFLQILLLAASAVVLSMTFYILPIVSRFYFSLKDLIKLSLLYCIKKFYITFFNFICLFGLIILITKLPTYFLLFAFSIFCYVIMLNEQGILREIEEKYKPKPGSENA